MDNLVHIGVTGSREGPVTSEQANAGAEVLDYLYLRRSAFFLHHGDCVGVDQYMAEIDSDRYWVISHPPASEGLRAHAYADDVRPEKPFLGRNRDIVNETSLLIAMPREDQEVYTGGTWYTVRYARTIGKGFWIVWPDGSLSINDLEPVWNWKEQFEWSG